MAKEIDWEALNRKLPTEKTAEQKARRAELFNQFDPNGNGYLSLAEIDRGCREVLGLYELFQAKKVIMRAFQASKGVNNVNVTSASDHGPDYVERIEFRLLLLYLKQYFAVWQVFEDVDTGNDHRIDYDEFAAAVPKLKEKGLALENPRATFAEIDANNGGQLLFDEFADWAVKNLLGVDGEPSE
eukprot:Nitzschia sp. Nitz4//scaffold150_size53981//17328//17882//NITZ4_006674-RA/size53981-processed-gene-0.27-mRNA-1//-1//CDS//3329537062//4614//frame0